MNKTTLIHSVFALALLAPAGCAQNPPPPAAVAPPAQPTGPGAPTPPAPGPAAAGHQMSTAATVTETGPVRYIVFGPQGEVQTVILRNEKIVNFPPDLGAQMRTAVLQGTSISVTGTPQNFGRQRQIVAQSVQVNGRTFASGAPSTLAPGQPPLPRRGAARPLSPDAQPTPPPPPAR